MLDKSAALPIYNSRNYSILLNNKRVVFVWKSTTVEIILYYLTFFLISSASLSTTVEIILYYLTSSRPFVLKYLQQ